jgi:hypothetical protein
MELSSTSIKATLAHFFRRYHLLIFTLSVLGGLIVCMLLINSIIVKSGDTSDHTPAAPSTGFDKETMERLKVLRTANDTQPDDLDLSKGRTNPFVE